MNPQAVHVRTVQDGKVVALQQYIDTLKSHRQLGQCERVRNFPPNPSHSFTFA